MHKVLLGAPRCVKAESTRMTLIFNVDTALCDQWPCRQYWHLSRMANIDVELQKARYDMSSSVGDTI